METLAAQINQLLEASQTATVEPLIEAGRLLIQIKEQLAHGEWQPWCKANIKWSYRHVARAMKAARQPEVLEQERAEDRERKTKYAGIPALLKEQFPWSHDRDNEREIAAVIKAIKRCSLDQRAYLWVNIYPMFKPTVMERIEEDDCQEQRIVLT